MENIRFNNCLILAGIIPIVYLFMSCNTGKPQPAKKWNLDSLPYFSGKFDKNKAMALIYGQPVEKMIGFDDYTGIFDTTYMFRWTPDSSERKQMNPYLLAETDTFHSYCLLDFHYIDSDSANYQYIVMASTLYNTYYMVPKFRTPTGAALYYNKNNRWYLIAAKKLLLCQGENLYPDYPEFVEIGKDNYAMIFADSEFLYGVFKHYYILCGLAKNEFVILDTIISEYNSEQISHQGHCYQYQGQYQVLPVKNKKWYDIALIINEAKPLKESPIKYYYKEKTVFRSDFDTLKFMNGKYQ